ncbi:MAG TPA: hypothetical protein VIL41_08210, partial [Coriobacteriia bacterium]
TMTVLDAMGTVTTQVSLPASVKAPVQAGQAIGAVQVARAGIVVASVPLVADRNVATTPLAVLAPRRAAPPSAAPNLWQRIATMVAGFGRMLGI